MHYDRYIDALHVNGPFLALSPVSRAFFEAKAM